MKQGLSDDIVANRVINKLTRHGPADTLAETSEPVDNSVDQAPWSGTKQQLGERLFPKVARLSGRAAKVTGMLLEAPVKDVTTWIHSETLLKAKVREAETCLSKAGQATWADRVKGNPKAPPTKGAKGGKGKPSQAQNESSGRKERPPQPHVPSAGPPRCAVRILPGEWSGKPQVTTMTQILRALREGEQLPGNLILVRDSSVVNELKQIWNAYELQAPCTVAVEASTSAAGFTGGSWEKLVHPKGPLLVAHLRVPEALATKVCTLSGKRGLFATTLSKESRSPVQWATKTKDQSDEEYFRAVCSQAQEKKVGVAFRQHGPHHLGLIGIASNVNPMTRRRAWEVYGAPVHWYQDHITSFLEEEGWKEVQVRSKLRRRGQQVWLVHAICPQFQAENPDQAAFWQYSDPQGECHISITLEKRQTKKVLPTEKVQAPRKKMD